MRKKKITAIVLIVTGLAIMSVPLIRYLYGNHQTKGLVDEFVQEIGEKEHEEGKEKDQDTSEAATHEEETAALLQSGVIGLIEIEAIDMLCPIREGAGSGELAYAIGHIPDTAGIGKEGNCVLAGHRGSRNGTFFKYLNRLSEGDEVRLTDKAGNTYSYVVEDSHVVGAYDNSVKNQGEERELTLLTCENSGTMRLVVNCAFVKETRNEEEAIVKGTKGDKRNGGGM